MKIKLFVMDVDGTLTDGKIYMGENGEVCKAFHVKDGYGIRMMLMPAGICPVIITGRSSKILENRCRELGITQLYQNIADKVVCLNEVFGDQLDYSQVAYIGDDLNDLTCMELIRKHGGLVGCPADAVSKVKESADYICAQNGGNGAVREFIEWILYGQIDE